MKARLDGEILQRANKYNASWCIVGNFSKVEIKNTHDPIYESNRNERQIFNDTTDQVFDVSIDFMGCNDILGGDWGKLNYMNEFDRDVQEYFERFDGIALERLNLIRDMIFSILPNAQETIKYGIPTFTSNGNLVHYAAFKKHIGFYPIPSSIEAFKNELSNYKQGKGSIQFPYSEELPIELIKKIVYFRIEENRTKREKS